jgi:hypothetical protein
MKARQGRPNQPALVADWNANVAVGDAVEYREFPESTPQTFNTCTEAQMLGGHTAVLWLNGKSGCVAVQCCKKVAVPTCLVDTLLKAKRERARTPTNEPMSDAMCQEIDMAYHQFKQSGGPLREHDANALRLQMRYGTVDGK